MRSHVPAVVAAAVFALSCSSADTNAADSPKGRSVDETVKSFLGDQRFSWRDMNDTAEIDVKVHVPIDEPAGAKIVGLVFYGEQS